ncbi:MAG TPA: hypothetical protein HA362_03045 [Nanoarchaeota archaeon]|nr:hypothetical protein [Nanoarchaeota archaeon]
MRKRCDCPKVCKDSPDKTFEEIIGMGLICEECANSYKEFSKIVEAEVC